MRPYDDQPSQRFDVLPQRSDDYSPYDMDADQPADLGGPGCLVWTLMGLFSLMLAFLVVLLAGLAGYADGLSAARAHATATHDAEIGIQCERTRGDLNVNSLGLVEARLNYLLTQTPAPACLSELIPMATQRALDAQPSPTPSLTPTSPPTLAPSATPTLTPAALPIATNTPSVSAASPTPASDYDLAGLLQEAQSDVSAGNYRRAIDTLEAIAAIDPQYQKATVDRLLFQALQAYATRLYRVDQRYAEAIVYTERARQYGDVGDLGYEQFLAELYLAAQSNLNVNYPAAIRALERIIYEQGLTNYANGEAARLLFEQTVAYGDALAAGGEPCRAFEQYESALEQRPQAPSVLSKRDALAPACGANAIATPAPGEQPSQPSGQTSEPSATTPQAEPTRGDSPFAPPASQSGG